MRVILTTFDGDVAYLEIRNVAPMLEATLREAERASMREHIEGVNDVVPVLRFHG